MNVSQASTGTKLFATLCANRLGTTPKTEIGRLDEQAHPIWDEIALELGRAVFVDKLSPEELLRRIKTPAPIEALTE